EGMAKRVATGRLRREHIAVSSEGYERRLDVVLGRGLCFTTEPATNWVDLSKCRLEDVSPDNVVS
ncbi:MAG: hypothetical protein ABW047_05380, partial [Nitrospiraceae bacterium]